MDIKVVSGVVVLYGSRMHTAYALLERAVGGQEIARDAYGKPYFPRRPDLHFSLSHSGGLALCGVGTGPLGVDIELVRPRRAGLPRYALTDLEHGDYLARGGGWGDFCALWTRREAWVKYTGLGVARSRGRDMPGGLLLREFQGDIWRAAVCAQEEIGPILWE